MNIRNGKNRKDAAEMVWTSKKEHKQMRNRYFRLGIEGGRK